MTSRSVPDITAKVVRIMSVPPVMMSLLFLILYLNTSIFEKPSDVLVPVICFGFVPVLAYAFQPFLPGFKGKGRDGQRKLAFIFSALGAIAAVIWAKAAHTTKEVLLICSTYFFSVVVLAALNKGFHIKASGHASSAAGPLIYIVYFIHWLLLFPAFAVGVLIAWSSVRLKRHTVKEFLLGCAATAAAFALSYVIIAR